MPARQDEFFKTLADPTGLFERLCRVGEIGALTGRREGRQTHHSAQLAAPAPLVYWASEMTGFWEGRL